VGPEHDDAGQVPHVLEEALADQLLIAALHVDVHQVHVAAARTASAGSMAGTARLSRVVSTSGKCTTPPPRTTAHSKRPPRRASRSPLQRREARARLRPATGRAQAVAVLLRLEVEVLGSPEALGGRHPVAGLVGDGANRPGRREPTVTADPRQAPRRLRRAHLHQCRHAAVLLREAQGDRQRCPLDGPGRGTRPRAWGQPARANRRRYGRGRSPRASGCQASPGRPSPAAAGAPRARPTAERCQRHRAKTCGRPYAPPSATAPEDARAPCAATRRSSCATLATTTAEQGPAGSASAFTRTRGWKDTLRTASPDA
jgi:hypothetical protein